MCSVNTNTVTVVDVCILIHERFFLLCCLTKSQNNFLGKNNKLHFNRIMLLKV